MTSYNPQTGAQKFVFVAAPFTPFQLDGEVNYAMISQQAEKLIRDGVSGAFICGTTGEGVLLTSAERKAIAEKWMEIAGERLNVFVHVGHTCTRDAIELAKHASQIGASAIAAIGPSFFAPSSPAALVEMYGRIADASSLPFYYYHMPSMTRVTYKASDLLPLLAERIPTFAGIKYTHNDVEDFALCVAMSEGRYKMLFGRDEILLEGLRAGAVGAVGSTYNYTLAIYHQVLDAWQQGDAELARSLQARATNYINIFIKYGGLEAGKALMKMCGVDCGAPRLPLEALSPEAFGNLEAEMNAAGFFQHLLAK